MDMNWANSMEAIIKHNQTRFHRTLKVGENNTDKRKKGRYPEGDLSWETVRAGKHLLLHKKENSDLNDLITC